METRFGEFVFDPGQRVVRRGAELVPIAPKAFQLLEMLIENRPNAVDRNVLYDALWPDTIVDEGNLKNLIGELRAALGDNAKRPRFIRTAARFGYAFMGEVNAPVVLLVYAGTVIPLGEGEHVIGRSGRVAVPIDSPLVSRRHARIVVAHGAATVEDLDSKNGTFVNSERIRAPRTLRDADEIKIADVIALHLRFAGGDSTVTKSA